MDLSSLLLLGLFWLPVNVYCQTEFPYVSFMGERLLNHSYVDLRQLGDPNRDGGEGLHCHTDLSTCCSAEEGSHRGDWYFPDGSRLPFSGDDDIFEGRAERRVYLRRRNNSTTPTGLYHCDIPTSENPDVNIPVYVGVHSSGGDLTMSEGVRTDTSSMYRVVLSCITAGGPATTVTWTRNCIPITERISTGIDSRITLQYTHNLTITRLLDGVYTCSISNNKPSQVAAVYPAQAQLLTVPSITVKPVSASTVRVSWKSHHYLSTSLQYTSYFSSTGATMSHSERVLPLGVEVTEVTLNDDIDGYKHNFTLHYIICGIIPNPTTKLSFAFDKKHFQIQFGPIDYCLNWKVHKSYRIGYQLRSRLADIIREQCTDCHSFSAAYLREGFFLCHENPTFATYRSTLISPFPTPTAADLVEIIQNWVSSHPSLILEKLLVKVSPSCPTSITNLDADECGDDIQPSSTLYEMVTQTLSSCAVEQLGLEICTR